jgi:gluconokinase
MYILALESSTTSAKAMLYDTNTHTYKVESKAYEFEGMEVGLHDPDYVFSLMVEIGKEIAAGHKIDAVALGGTWHSIMLCDKDMKPKTSLYHWTYTGAADLCQKLREDKDYVRRYYQKTGCMVNATYPFFKLKLLREMGWALEDYNIVDQGVYNTYNLTGQYVITDITASGMGMLDVHKRRFDPELLKDLGIGLDNMPKVVKYNHSCVLSEEGAKLLGLTSGIPVLPTSADGSLNLVGSGALKDGVVSFSVGTSGAIRLATEQPVIPEEPSTWCYISPTGWLTGAATAGCCNCVDWYKNMAFGPETSYSQIEEGFNKLSEKPAVFLPFLFGERCPGWMDNRLGGFMDLRPEHSNYDLYHAVLEGVLFNIYQCYEILTRVSGVVPGRIKLTGGILKSPYWSQMAADIFGRNIEMDPAENASLMGAATIAMEKLGVINDLTDISSPVGKVLCPDPKKKEYYIEGYSRYKYWYDRSV